MSAPPHFVRVYWRLFWHGQRTTRTHLFRDYPERGYDNRSPEEGHTLCGEMIPDYYREAGTGIESDAFLCKRCQRTAGKLMAQEAH